MKVFFITIHLVVDISTLFIENKEPEVYSVHCKLVYAIVSLSEMLASSRKYVAH